MFSDDKILTQLEVPGTDASIPLLPFQACYVKQMRNIEINIKHRMKLFIFIERQNYFPKY